MTIDVSNTDRLDQCDDCGRPYVSSAGHKCYIPDTPLTKDPSPTTIAVLGSHDDNDPDALIAHTDSRWSTAYHKSAVKDGERVVVGKCQEAKRSDDTSWVFRPRNEAQADRRHPCSRCHDLDLDEIYEELEARGEV